MMVLLATQTIQEEPTLVVRESSESDDNFVEEEEQQVTLKLSNARDLDAISK